MDTKAKLQIISDKIKEYAASNNENITWSINNGGCGLFAALIAAKLGLQESIRVQHVGYTKDIESDFKSVNVCHIYLEIDNEYYDCTGFKNPKYVRFLKSKLSYEKLLEELQDTALWNSNFRGERYIPVINDILETAINK